MIDLINHRDLAEERLAVQFSESTKLINYIKSILRESDDLEQVFQDLLEDRWLDTAVGVQLDILGDIVGQERGFTQNVNDYFFGFKGSIGSDTFGTIGTAGTGSNFRSTSDVEFIDIVFDDATYRIFIYSKIAKNKTKVTINEVIDVILQGITSVATVTVSEDQARFRLTFPGTLSDNDKLLLAKTTFTPRPAGVGVSYEDNDGVFS